MGCAASMWSNQKQTLRPSSSLYMIKLVIAAACDKFKRWTIQWKYQNVSISVKICTDLSRSVKICQDLSRSVKIYQDLPRPVKICEDLSRSAKILQDLLEYVKIWRDLTRSTGICQNMQWLTFCVVADAPEQEWLMAMEMFISDEAVSEWRRLSIIYKESKVCKTFEKDLKKICKRFEKDL